MKKRWMKCSFALLLVLGTSWGSYSVLASDHDDGTQTVSQNDLNLTDLFVFREDNQTSNSADRGNLVLIMDSNGHTAPNRQVFFNTAGVYDFHISRVAASAVNTTPTGAENMVIRFTFSDPDASSHQSINVSFIRDGIAAMVGSDFLSTTSLADGKSNSPKIGTVMVDGQAMTVFAGLREDPFFFDVEQFFKVRAGALGTGPVVGFKSSTTAVDGFANQNVNSIVVRVPISLLQSAGEPVFDTWITTGK